MLSDTVQCFQRPPGHLEYAADTDVTCLSITSLCFEHRPRPTRLLVKPVTGRLPSCGKTEKIDNEQQPLF